MNILDGHIEVDPSISDPAKDLMQLLLRPTPSQRPSARELLDHEFFGKLSKGNVSTMLRNSSDKIAPSAREEAQQQDKARREGQKVDQLIQSNQKLMCQLELKEKQCQQAIDESAHLKRSYEQLQKQHCLA